MSVVVGFSIWALLLTLGLWFGRRLRVFRDGMDAERGPGWSQ